MAPPDARTAVARRARLDSLTGLRAVAALAVFFAHIVARFGPEQAGPFSHLAVQGGLGVTFFFALSGFVLTWSFQPGDGAARFWQRRFARICPAYLVALLGGTLVTVAAAGRGGVSEVQSYDSASELVGPFIAQATLLQSWIPDDRYFFSLNGVGWSLSCEAFFYACFPLLITRIWRTSAFERRIVQVLCLCLLLVAAVAVDRGADQWLVHQFPLVRLLDFILGVTVGVDVIRGSWAKVRLGPALALAAAVYAVAGWWPSPYTVSALPAVPFLAVIAAATYSDLTGVRSVFASRTFVWLGEVSFAFYLVHQMVIRCLGVFGESSTWAGALWRLCLALGLGLLAAWLLHRAVERPAERRLRGSGRSSRPSHRCDDAGSSPVRSPTTDTTGAERPGR